jgi:Phytanoyl-CoA dioxygenase (PhyH)
MKLSAFVSHAKSMTDPRYRSFYWQRTYTDQQVREAKASEFARSRPQWTEPISSAAAAKTATLNDTGYVMMDQLLSAGQIAELKAHLATRPLTDAYRKDDPSFVGPQSAPPGTFVAHYSAADVIRAPHTLRIANDPGVLSVVAGMLGAKPTISLMASWWSIPSGHGAPQQAENFHRDVDDWRFVKLFVYLTDVDATAGPHKFVKGSHKINKLTEIRRFNDDEVAQTFGLDNQIEFQGAAGTCFLENTYGVHRGVPPATSTRLMFQVLYALQPTIYGPKAPLARLTDAGIPAGLDPYINQVYLSP